MAAVFDNVHIAIYKESGYFDHSDKAPHRIEIIKEQNQVTVNIYCDGSKKIIIPIDSNADYARVGRQSIVFSKDQTSFQANFASVHVMKSFLYRLNEFTNGRKSVFSERTDDASAVQYFQFYGYLSQQQNMMQDYIRTSTYQRAMLANIDDFHDKVILDVGAGSGILSFFAIQAGARKVYAIEASSMAQHCEMLVKDNRLVDQIVVITGKVEDVTIPEEVDTIISEPMGYMLFNERMLESFLHAKKWLKPGGRMFPTQGDLHVAPFTDEALYMEQYSKANFWYQESFHGVNLISLRNAAVTEYFRQPIVDTFDIRICLAKSNKHVVDFQKAREQDLHIIDIPLTFSMMQSGLVHGLAFWFDVAFFGTNNSVWLSTAPTEALTHWYQVRCLVQTPVLVKQGQTLTGKVLLRCNKRQSYDVDIELNIPGTNTKSTNSLDLKNPYFRYTGQTPQPPAGNSNQSPSDSYWNSVATGNLSNNCLSGNQSSYINGILNGLTDNTQVIAQQGVVQTNLIPLCSSYENMFQRDFVHM
ncbi:histone-arginine methyltransferase CARM1 isoform X1 [Octopus bimaculoides]|uniref:type I protein arginine methyltransferase n=2 Tax=Octopus bimaculoides TaxID=37653 RepID=A0A0L8HFM9_OCTBM|nr:histone-arginine methyltransferase CARM1 isoform X1 [Octopus bimaculoides]|eukprot:XP_014773022.1 PREDICTED: histone-arginine methyltransferase CARM1-like isoform X1 [Octopus bimaculoides]